MNHLSRSIDWLEESKNISFEKLSSHKLLKYKIASTYINNLFHQNCIRNVCELGAGPGLLGHLLDEKIIYDQYDKYPATNDTMYVDIDDYNSLRSLHIYDCIVMMGTIEYSADFIKTILSLEKSKRYLILYATHPILSSRLSIFNQDKWRHWSGFKLFITSRKFKHELKALGLELILTKKVAADLTKFICSHFYVFRFN